MSNTNQALTTGTLLRGKVYTYRIERVLGQGTFGITYLASTNMHGPLGDVTVQVAVKEFFAKELDSRMPDGTVTSRTEEGVAQRYARAFLRESENLSKVKHPGIVKVLESFEDKGTCYYSMEYLSGGTLDEKVAGTGIPEAEALAIVAKIGEALSFMHEHQMMHLDLKPKNIMLKADGSPVIIDFGLSKQYDASGEPESSTTIGLGTPGYAPIEQANHSAGRLFQPTIDIYALGATLYKMLAGYTPPPASDIFNEGFPVEPLQEKKISTGTMDAIRRAMSAAKKDRPQRVSDFLSLLGNNTDEETIPQSITKSELNTGPFPGKKTSKNWVWTLIGGIAAAAIITAIVLGGRNRKPADEDSLALIDSTSIASAIDSSSLDTPAPQASTKSEPVVRNEQPAPAAPIEKPTPVEKPTVGTLNGHDWVDMGLSVKWATCNVGASSPSDYGSYFAWGETRPKSDYSMPTYRHCIYFEGDYVSLTKYNTSDEFGVVDNKMRLEMVDDAARQNWGGTWRMPTDDEWIELHEKCTWTWTEQGGKNGCMVTSKVNGNSIFLPVAGLVGNPFSGVKGGTISHDAGGNGYYWSSSLFEGGPDDAMACTFDDLDGSEVDLDHWGRFVGFSIRPVTK